MNPMLTEYLDELGRALKLVDLKSVANAAELVEEAFKTENTVYVFGNGASAALASHMACDLTKGTSANDFGSGPGSKSARRLRIVALNDCIPMLTAISNDVAYNDVFMEPLKAFLCQRDVVIGISGSGESPSVVRALEYARTVGAGTISFTGARQSADVIRRYSDVCVAAPLTSMEQIEDLHVIFNHLLVVLLRQQFGRLRKEMEVSCS